MSVGRYTLDCNTSTRGPDEPCENVSGMIIHLHASCWNEARMLPLFFRYYDAFVDRYFIHDNQSDDGSLDILAAHSRVTVLPLVLEGDSFVDAAFAQVNRLWWPSRGEADWVAVCNIDEFFWHPDMSAYLASCQSIGITFLGSTGYQMVSERFPGVGENLPETIRRGARFLNMDKPSFFNPDAITDSGFGVARHTCSPSGRVVRAECDEILLLHYKHLGLKYLLARHAELDARRRKLDRAKGYGYHYDRRVTLERHERYLAEANNLVPGDWKDRRSFRQHILTIRFRLRLIIIRLFKKIKRK